MTTTLSFTTDEGTNVKALRADERIVTRGSPGVDAWGLYGEIDCHFDGGSGVYSTVRFLYAGDHLFWQKKLASKRAAHWLHYSAPSLEDAARLLRSLLPANTTNQLRGAPIVTQFVATDVESIKSGNAPQGRYTAKTAYEKLYGEGV
jgi:hypothetical protein